MAKSRKPIVVGGEVIDGKVHWDSPRLVSAVLKGWKGRVTVTIAPELETRRDKQNRYYRGVVVKMIADESDHHPDQIHELLKVMFNSEVIEVENSATGEIEEQRISRSTVKLSVQDFCDYVERCKVWAAEFFGLIIPEADSEYSRKRTS